MGATAEHDEAVLVDIKKRFFDDFDAHVDALVVTMREQIVEYQAVPAADIRVSSSALVATVVGMLPGIQPNTDDLAPLAELARRRAEQGFPPEALARSIQFGARHVLAEVDRLAAESNVDPAVLLRLHDATWQFATDASTVIFRINHEIAVDLGERESAHRADFLRAVLRGALPPEHLAVETRNFGLDPSARYHPLRARPADSREEERLSLIIRRTGATHAHRPIVAVVDGDLVGLSPQRPDVADAPVVVGIGEAVPLGEVAASFRAATLALDTARLFGRSGVVGLDELGPLPLILLGEDLASVMQHHHFSQLDLDQPGDLDVARTVWTWLTCDQNVDEVARRLHIHRNTVRYRLTRFRELTALDVHRTEDLVIAWWILGRRVGTQRP
ncbi:MAG: PucR family transcriptional regulator [Mycobacterium sp.]